MGMYQVLRKLAPIMASHVEWLAEMVRQFGFGFPTEYDFGLAITRGGTLHLRINDVRYKHQIRWPDQDDDLNAIDQFTADLVRAATTVVHLYVDKHLKLSPEQAKKMKEVIMSEGYEDKVVRQASRAARLSTYEVK